MAYRAGARIADLKFVFQFHPTALDVAGAPRVSCCRKRCAVKSARLVNHADEAFALRTTRRRGDRAARIACRARFCRSSEHARAARVSIRDAASGGRRRCTRGFPFISENVPRRRARSRPRSHPGEPGGAHYVMGGVETDVDGRTSIPGLFAAGRSGLHRRSLARTLSRQQLAARRTGVPGCVAGHEMRQWVARATAHADADADADAARRVRTPRTRGTPGTLTFRQRPGRGRQQLPRFERSRRPMSPTRARSDVPASLACSATVRA